MKRYVDAIGGAAAFSKVQGVVVSGRLQTEAGEVVGHMTTWRARPDRVKARTELVGYPPMEIGYDGVTGWSRAGSDPTKTLAGPELVQIKRQASEILSLADPDARFTKATTLARGTFEGKDSWKVALETNDGQKLTSWLAPDTGLQRGFETTFLTPNGEIPVTVVTLEYRLFGGAGGLKLPTVLMQHSGDRKTQMTIDEVSVNPPELPTFSPP